MKWIKLPIEVLCQHGKNFVDMKIEPCDPEVPSYLATCPKCKKKVIIAFSDFLTDNQDREESP